MKIVTATEVCTWTSSVFSVSPVLANVMTCPINHIITTETAPAQCNAMEAQP
jgi:hypothetical protein